MAKINWQLALSNYLEDETSSYTSIAQKYGVSLQAVKKRASKEGWVNLRIETIQKVDQKLSEKVSNELANVNFRHIKVSRKLQDEGIEFIRNNKLKLKNFNQAVNLLKKGIEIERKALGMDK